MGSYKTVKQDHAVGGYLMRPAIRSLRIQGRRGRLKFMVPRFRVLGQSMLEKGRTGRTVGGNSPRAWMSSTSFN